MLLVNQKKLNIVMALRSDLFMMLKGAYWFILILRDCKPNMNTMLLV